MGLEKIIPRFSSFIPGILYVNAKKSTKQIYVNQNTWKEELLDDPKYIKSSKEIGFISEGARAAITLIFGLTSRDLVTASIAYVASTYIIDRLSAAGIILGN